MLIRPSDVRKPPTDLPSPPPLSRLGACRAFALLPDWSLANLGFRLRGLSLADEPGGRLVDRWSPRGGCGKELMLTVFLIVFEVATELGGPLYWDQAEVGTREGVTRLLDGARRPVLGVVGVEGEEV